MHSQRTAPPADRPGRSAERRPAMAVNRRELTRELEELIAALDRRVPRVEEAGEAAIARDAAALRPSLIEAPERSRLLGGTAIASGAIAVDPSPARRHTPAQPAPLGAAARRIRPHPALPPHPRRDRRRDAAGAPRPDHGRLLP